MQAGQWVQERPVVWANFPVGLALASSWRLIV